jgi:hypothetical protein
MEIWIVTRVSDTGIILPDVEIVSDDAPVDEYTISCIGKTDLNE